MSDNPSEKVELVQSAWQPLPNGREVEILVRDKGQRVNREDGHDLPTMAIVWDPRSYQPKVVFDTLDFPSWNWVEAVLHFAQEIAKSQIQMSQTAFMDNMRAKLQQDALLAQQLHGKDLKKIQPGR